MDFTTHTSWPPLFWSGMEAPQSICTCVLARSAQASLSGRADQRMHGQVPQYRLIDLVQLPIVCDLHCVRALVRKPHTKLCTVCAPLGVPPTLAQSAGSEVVVEQPSRLPWLSRPHHPHDAPPSLRLSLHGMLLQLVPPRMVLSAGSTSDNVPSSLIFKFCSCRAPLTFHPQLDCVRLHSSSALGSCYRFAHAQCILLSW